MIAKEFLLELEKIHELFEWKLVPDTHWQPERRSRPRLRIRGFCKLGPKGFIFEPIGAVCYVRTGRTCGEDAWIEAATTIKLSLIDASDLIAAANDRVWSEVDGLRQPHAYVQRLRECLAAAVALELAE